MRSRNFRSSRPAARADPGEEPGGDLHRGQVLQQVTGASDRQVMRTGQQRGLGQLLGLIRSGEPGAATISTCPFGTVGSSQPAAVTAPQPAHAIESSWYSATFRADNSEMSITCRRCRPVWSASHR